MKKLKIKYCNNCVTPNTRPNIDFDNFGRRMNDSEGDFIPEEDRLTRTNAGQRRRREMTPMYEASGRM